MQQTLIDSHCHFDFEAFDAERDTLWSRCQRLGIQQLLIPGVAPASWNKARTLTETFANLYFSCGLHPWFIAEADSWQDKIDALLEHPRCVAIGECGLDGAIELPLSAQLPFFNAQLQLAEARQKPLIIHAHRAHNDVLQQLKQHSLPAGGVVHGFSGSVELAQSYIRLGFKIGIGGTITYPRAAKTRRAAAQLPLESILLETDAPSMPLCGQQGAPNSPEYLPQIAQTLFALRREVGKTETLDEICRQTTDNARQLFNLHATP